MDDALLPEACLERLAERLPGEASCLSLPAPPGAAVALLCATLAEVRGGGLLIAVAEGPIELETLAQDWQTLFPGRRALLLAPLEHASSGDEGDAEALGALLDTLRRIDTLPAATPAVLLTCTQALLHALPDPGQITRRTLNLTVGATLTPDDPSPRLAAMGYRRTDTVFAPGEFAIRGGILDIWTPDAAQPLRIERFGAEIESLRLFDPATQRTTGRVDRAHVLPANLVAPASAGQRLLSRRLPEGLRLLWLEPARIDAQCRRDDERLEGLREGLAPALECFAGTGAPPEAVPWVAGWSPIDGLADTGAGGAPPDAMARARAQLIESLRRQARSGRRVLLFSDTPGTRDRLRETLGARDFQLRVGALSGGFSLPAADCIVVAQPDLYGRRARLDPRRPARRGATGGARIDTPAHLQPGDLVVHVDHGIGRFRELGEIDVGGRRAEVLTIEYADQALLHVPVAQSHLLSRYVGVGGHDVRLHRLGGRRWQRERIEAEKAVQDLAASLLETQARRQTQAGFAFDTDPPWMHAFEAAFPYPETPDQLRTLAEIKADLGAARPMDRLVCGDAGYGKTEVAIRAAFIAVMQGKQVAVLTPTTVLAEQHDRTFRDRMAAYPVRIETLSRFRSPAHRESIRRELGTGAIDIVIGTHALLHPGITFRDLGLLIIDEEQRFGVAHKERLKQIRHLLDVLTLTATPIPRTLYLSMTGARDMSLLQTPPQQRQAVDTRVVEDRDDIIRQAVMRELHREGQVYFLYNRVLTLPRMLRRLQALVPEARIGVAHGQMPSRELSRVMQTFAEGRIDLLLCTTIVESGLDIPRANTILIHRADRFGIADLYQLRGRVGRSSHRAHALLLLPPLGLVDPDARRRLQALQRHSGLGSGFQLALRDLEIRGAGNLLGAAQSGHIAAVGFGLYCQLLKRTVARLRGETPPTLVDVALSLDFIDLSPAAPAANSATLPYDYVSDEAERIALHKQLAEAVSRADVKALRENLADRFGPLPPAADRLLRLAALRILAAEKGIERIEARGERLLVFRDGQPLRIRSIPAASRHGSPDKRLQALLRAIRALTR